MTVKINILTAILLSFFYFPEAQANWQYWNVVGAKHKLQENLTGTIKSEQKVNDDIGFFEYHFNVGAIYGVRSWLDLQLNYRFQQAKSKDLWREEHRPDLGSVFKWTAGEFNLANRHRLEYRIREGRDNSYRYRLSIKASRKVNISGHEILAFLSDEIFYDFAKTNDEFNKNRASVGISKKLTKSLKFTLFHVLEHNKVNESWLPTHVVGTTFMFSY